MSFIDPEDPPDFVLGTVVGLVIVVTAIIILTLLGKVN